MGSQLPLKGAHAAPVFVPFLNCEQTAGWMKTPLGTEVDLGRGHIVLDGDPAPPPKGHSSPLLFWANIYCGRGRPSQLLVSSCYSFQGANVTVRGFPKYVIGKRIIVRNRKRCPAT